MDIDAIFRVSAMLSDSKTVVLNLEHHIPSIGISVPGQKRSLRISGTVDYTALTTDPAKHGASFLSVYLIAFKLPVESFIRNSLIQYVKRQNPNGLFVTEAKQEGVPLAQHVAQAVAEMYASAKYLTYDSGFLPTLFTIMLSHIPPGRKFYAALSLMGMNGFS
jgi:hypothetical protein